MNNEDESRALEHLHNTTSLGRIFEHRILYRGELQPGQEYPCACAMQLSENCHLVFTVSAVGLGDGHGPVLSFEFIAFFDRRDKAIEAVFSLIPK